MSSSLIITVLYTLNGDARAGARLSRRSSLVFDAQDKTEGKKGKEREGKEGKRNRTPLKQHEKTFASLAPGLGPICCS